MSNKHEQARAELDAILKGLMTDKHLRQSDKMLIAKAPGSEWHTKTAERNRKNAGSEEISKKISEATKGKKVKLESIEKAKTTRKLNGNTSSWNKGISPSKETREKISTKLAGRSVTDEVKVRLQFSSAKCKPIIIPEGIFWSRAQASKYIISNGLTHLKSWQSVGVWLSKMLNDPLKVDYKFISREEYVMLTGKDPFNESAT